MGISDDIKPKKVHRYVEHSSSRPKAKPEPEKKEPEIDEEELLLEDLYHNPEKLEHLEDDFFAAHHKREQSQAENVPKPHRPIKRFIVLILFLGLVALIIYQNFDIIKSYFVGEPNKETTENNNQKEETYTGETPSSSSTSSTPTITTTPTEQSTTPSPATQTFTIEVLNGNGVSGSADKVKTTLINAGYPVDKVTNAKNYSYQKTYIYYKTGKADAAAKVQTALSGRDCVLEASDTVAANYDVVVVVGKS